MKVGGYSDNDGGDRDFIPFPKGAHPLVCYGLVDLGTKVSHFDSSKKSRQVWLAFEGHGSRCKLDNGRPMSISRSFAAFLGSDDRPTNLRRFLQAWTGEDNIDEFDMEDVLGEAGMGTIIHKPQKSNPGKVSARIESMAPLYEGMSAPERVNELVYFDFDAGHGVDDIPSAIPQWVRDEIEASDQYKELTGQPISQVTPKEGPQTTAELPKGALGGAGGKDDDEDVFAGGKEATEGDFDDPIPEDAGMLPKKKRAAKK